MSDASDQHGGGAAHGGGGKTDDMFAAEFAAINHAAAKGRPAWQVHIVDECASTQDLAKTFDRPGCIVVARRQTGGRGRLGRAWADTANAGLAMSMTFSTVEAVGQCDGVDGHVGQGSLPLDPGVLSIGIGLAACVACEQVLGAGSPVLGLRWPNDVVERTSGRKVAGVLIERFSDVYVVGVGVNCAQRRTDWPAALRGRAVSLVEIDSSVARATLRGDVAATIVGAIVRTLGMSGAEIARAWIGRDTLVGTRRVFEHDGRRIAGMVESIEPRSHLLVRSQDGVAHRLPAISTSMVHDAAC